MAIFKIEYTYSKPFIPHRYNDWFSKLDPEEFYDGVNYYLTY